MDSSSAYFIALCVSKNENCLVTSVSDLEFKSGYRRQICLLMSASDSELKSDYRKQVCLVINTSDPEFKSDYRKQVCLVINTSDPEFKSGPRRQISNYVRMSESRFSDILYGMRFSKATNTWFLDIKISTLPKIHYFKNFISKNHIIKIFPLKNTFHHWNSPDSNENW
jgi:ribosomal protein L36